VQPRSAGAAGLHDLDRGVRALLRPRAPFPTTLAGEVEAALAAVENEVKKRLGDKRDPLLVSVRSGARVSMPGMMDTVLNLG
jgi:pyruvate,orthophosphate dikinase